MPTRPRKFLPDRPTRPRKPCDNCPKTFTPQKSYQRFCSDQCRKEYHKYGGAFRKLRDHFREEIPEMIREEMTAALEKERAERTRTLDEIRSERKRLLRALAEHAQQEARMGAGVRS